MGLRRLLVPVGIRGRWRTAGITLCMTLWLAPISVRRFPRRLENLAHRSGFLPFNPASSMSASLTWSCTCNDSAAATHWSGIFLVEPIRKDVSRLTVAKDAIVIADREQGKLELHLRTAACTNPPPTIRAITRFPPSAQRDLPVAMKAPRSLASPSRHSGRTSASPARTPTPRRQHRDSSPPLFPVRLPGLRADGPAAGRAPPARQPRRRIPARAAAHLRLLRDLHDGRRTGPRRGAPRLARNLGCQHLPPVWAWSCFPGISACRGAAGLNLPLSPGSRRWRSRKLSRAGEHRGAGPPRTDPLAWRASGQERAGRSPAHRFLSAAQFFLLFRLAAGGFPGALRSLQLL